MKDLLNFAFGALCLMRNVPQGFLNSLDVLKIAFCFFIRFVNSCEICACIRAGPVVGKIAFHTLQRGKHLLHLYPCAYSVTYNVTQRPQDDKPTLNMILNQRSQDILAANNWNVCQYAILLMMVAQSVDMIAGELLHVIADAHIYDRHVDIIRELIERPQFAAPKVTLNPDVHDFYAFTTDDLIVEGYEHGPQVKNIPIAV